MEQRLLKLAIKVINSSMRKSRLSIVPDKLFHKIWDAVNKNNNLNQYEIIRFINENVFIDYKKYGFDYVSYCFLISKAYKYSLMSFRDILEMADKRKAELSDIFCIPIRTIEEWYRGTNKCPSYIRLMILKQFHLLYLDKYMKLQSELDFYNTKPHIYAKRDSKVSISETEPKKITDKSDENITDQNDYILLDESEEEYDEYDAKRRKFFEKYGFFPDEQVRLGSADLADIKTKDVLAKTAYLKR